MTHLPSTNWEKLDWEYRGWKVSYAGEGFHSLNGYKVKKYLALKDKRYIDCEIDIDLIDMYVNSHIEENAIEDFVNQELNSYIEAADRMLVYPL